MIKIDAEYVVATMRIGLVLPMERAREMQTKVRRKEEGGPTKSWNRLAENRVASWFRGKGQFTLKEDT